MERAGATTLMGNPMTLVGPELKVGDKAPEFTALDNGLKPVTLSDTGHKTRIFSVVPSLDTPVCDAQTKRFNEEAGKLGDVDIYTVSMDLPFAQKRFCNSFALDNVKMLSDHRDASFGTAYGTLIKELRILSRAIFVVGPDDKIKYVEYVPEVSQHPELRSRSGRRQELTCRLHVPGNYRGVAKLRQSRLVQGGLVVGAGISARQHHRIFPRRRDGLPAGHARARGRAGCRHRAARHSELRHRQHDAVRVRADADAAERRRSSGPVRARRACIRVILCRA